MKINCKNTRYILGLFTVWRILLLIVAWISAFLIPKNPEYQTSWLNDISKYNLINIWFRWDSAYYIEIAKNGYEIANTVFFPLYPILIRYLGYIFANDYILTGLIISNLALLAALFYFYKLVRLDFEEKIAKKALFYFLIFPASIFLASVYTESLFIFLIIASFYYARKQKWWIASILGFFASLTRLAGVFLVLALLFEYLKQTCLAGSPRSPCCETGEAGRREEFRWKNIKPDILSLLLIPAGLASYMIYLHYKFGNALSFITEQYPRAREFIPIWITLTNYMGDVILRIKHFFTLEYFYTATELGFFILFLAFTIIVYTKIRKSYGIFMLFALLVPAMTGTLSSINRYCIALFPAFIVLALFGKNKYLHYFITILSIVLLIFYTALFVNLYWAG